MTQANTPEPDKSLRGLGGRSPTSPSASAPPPDPCTTLTSAGIDIVERSNETPAAQTLLAELGVADAAIVMSDLCFKPFRRQKPGSAC